MAVDRELLHRLVGVASDRVDAEQAKRDRSGESRMSAKQREILHGHALHEELQKVNRERISRGEVPLGAAEAEEHIAAAMNEMWHQGDAVERWLADDSWDEMDINGWDTVWVYFTDRGKERVDPLFRSDDELRDWLQSVARRGSEVGEYRFDQDAYRLNMELGEGCRLTALWGGRGVRGVGPRPYATIRRHRLRDFRIADLRRLGSLSPAMADLITASVHADLNAAVTGPTFAGKTTLTRAAIHESDPAQRWYVIERTPELQLLASGHSDVVEVLAREPSIEGKGEITLAQHVMDSLTMNPGHIALGEITDPADMAALLNAMSQGNDGSWCTLHARTAEDMLRRLLSLCQQVDLSLEASGSLVGGALDMIIYIGIEKRRDGTLRRFVSSVREVGDWNGHAVSSTEVCAPGPDGLAVPCAQFVTSAAKRLADVGYTHRVGAR